MLRHFCLSNGLFFLGEYLPPSLIFLYLFFLIFLYHLLRTSLCYSFLNFWEVPNFCSLILILCEGTHVFFLLFLSPRRILLFSSLFMGSGSFSETPGLADIPYFFFLVPLILPYFCNGAFPALSSWVFYYFGFWQCSFNTQFLVEVASVLIEGKWSCLCFSMLGSNTMVKWRQTNHTVVNMKTLGARALLPIVFK